MIDPLAARPDGERVKYGVLCLTADPAGVARCAQYGRSYLVLRGCRLRASFADQDTLGTPATLARTGLGRIAALRVLLLILFIPNLPIYSVPQFLK